LTVRGGDICVELDGGKTMFIKIGLGLAALVAAVAPIAASADDDVIQQLFDKANEIYSQKGYAGTGWEQRGTLQQGAEVRIPVKLSGGGEYSLVGVCDTDCSNMDIQLLDASGKEVAKDVEDDDFPIVGVTASGSYVARVIMVACKDSCAYGVKSFVK
jgi:hypothetical protein